MHWTCPLREQNHIETQFLQYDENGKFDLQSKVSVLINRVITRIYRISDQGREDWMKEEIALQYKWSIIVQSMLYFKDLGKISLHINQKTFYRQHLNA